MTTSRRGFVLAGAAGLSAASAQTASLTANEVIGRIRKNVGVPWRTETVDTFKAGNPDTRVTGIATSVMSTMDVLERSAAAGRNLVISHEPTFYNHLDETKDFSSDPVYQQKQAFIEKNEMVIWRFHDHWHARKPDAMLVGLAQAIGWEQYQDRNHPRRCTVPPMMLGDMAAQIQRAMKIRAMRVIGDPTAKMSEVTLNPGYTALQGAVKSLQDSDVLICGEPREWEAVEYVQDCARQGRRKALIVVGHAVSEDPGMDLCAKWLKTFVTEVPVEWIPAGEPFWRPQ